MSKITDSVQEKINKWKAEPVLSLAHHFHKFNKQQHVRVSEYTVSDLSTVKKNWNTMKKITIHLGLNNEKQTNDNVITFAPIFEIDGKYLEMEIITKQDKNMLKTNNGARVPEEYKEMVTYNWNTLDFHLIDDLFIVRDNGIPKRVTSYHNSGAVITALKELIPDSSKLNAINMYLGVDKNKFAIPSLTAFAPVIGFQYMTVKDPKKNPVISYFINSGNVACKKIDSEIEEGVIKSIFSLEFFMQYTSPCPPTC
ncbi:hypothetical protein [uncultured Kordia sp.]|uniref:hypothetical protein n=1 Tax=uncultured Kordia sp. TaxID=507699 RepID=UPI002604490A|nr:hypothetical protein [uncultured Kordia sp.]